ncbi:trypsin-like peptidase domain-containing protein [Actinoplanes sp. NPDC048967]|uniref:trypsin-like peptidase domain-containing protein n=1 Tax=Actinoplanes sp. NPDC048967 TaxID=3155269 RepID=UPI003408E266
MNEYETNPQRHESSPSEELSHRPADASPATGPERGQSDTTAQQPTLSQPAAPQSGVPQSGVSQSGAPLSGAPLSGAPQSGAPHSGIPQSGAPQSGAPQQQGAWVASPWQRGGQHPAQQHHTQQLPYGQQPYGAGQQQYPGQPQPPYAGAYAGQPHPQYAAQGAPGQPGQWTPGGGVPPQSDAPAWAQAVGTEQRDPARAGRGRKIFVAGAAAVLIALGAGGVGAATALAFDDDSNPRTVQTADASVNRVVDRSSLAQIVAAVKDSVVSITTQTGEGSGVVISADGYIVTNNHVVATATGDAVTVIFANGKKAQAKIVGTDPRTDLAVIKADGVSDLAAAKFGDSSKMQVGDTVLALGSPLGLEGSVTEGIISAKDRTIRSGGEDDQTPQNPFGGQQQQQQQSAGATSMSGLLQTDAPINPGNSGGALVNTNGEVIGINSAIATSGQGSGNIGLGFAIPSNKVKDVADALMAGKKVSHPALGVSVTEAEGGGALVSTVTEGSAAAKAGLERGDVINSVNGKAVNDSDDLIGIIQSAKVGDKVTVVFTRNGQQQTVSAALTEAS